MAYDKSFYTRLSELRDQDIKPKQIAEIIKKEQEDNSHINWPDAEKINNNLISSALQRIKTKPSSDGSKQTVSTDNIEITSKSISCDQIKEYIDSKKIAPYEEQEQFTKGSDGNITYVRTLKYIFDPSYKDVTDTTCVGEYTELGADTTYE